MTEPVLAIHGFKGWGSVIVEAACALVGEPYTLHEVEPGAPGPAFDALLRLNPLGQVPTVVLPDGTVMTESAAIILWLLERHPGSDLAPPPGDPRRPVFLRWLIYFVAAIYPMYTVGDYPARWGAEGEEAGNRLKEATVQRTLSCWKNIEENLSPGQYLLGDKLTMLDVYGSAMSRWRPGRARIRAVAPRAVAAAERAEAHPVLAEVFKHNFPT
ncbi:glutathione S-transferase family protein [Chondromyces apiculatus]|uniref:Glutathione S-transferase-like protein n=1 Tax=Chondromyces apiculatus DSM 436 TaxID=1192034 RepID=A0A017TAG0_9BACT|nr:glutathione S-transferase family protein [Chondromyces apiculatus]EYF06273.1 Glutathione S-transferase-like protein [Chondromyces apiculatus DSM 436]